MNKDGQVRVITAGVDNRRRRIIYLVPLFLGAVVFGFILELSTYESLSFIDFRQAIANLPKRWNRKPLECQLPSPYLDEAVGKSTREGLDVKLDDVLSDSDGIGDETGGLQEQTENETRIVNSDEMLSIKTNKTEEIPQQLKLWEQPTLLNLNPFSWIMSNESLCDPDPSTLANTRLMPILVHSARSHFEERLALRKSFGSIPIYKEWDTRFVFLLGEQDRGTNPEVNQKEFEEQQSRLDAEQKIFGDIVIGSFIDSYRNLTYKHLMGYKWVLNYCSHATFVLKIDDDMFIDIMRWLDWRTEDIDNLGKNPSAKIPDLYCWTFTGSVPIREKGSKWYASEEDWPDEYYPDYCSGWAYGIQIPLMKRLYLATENIKLFWIDDVFATGALMEVAKKKEVEWQPEVRHIFGNVTTDIIDYRPMCDAEDWNSTRLFQAVVYVPRGELFERDMLCMWNKTLHDSTYNWHS